jgi:uncharacterized protein
MSQSAAAQSDIEAIDYPALRDLVISDPGLILGDPVVMKALFESGDEGNVVDLGAVARARLQTEIRRLRKGQETMIEMARTNLAAQAQTHNAVLSIMEAATLADLDKKLAGRVAQALGVDVLKVYIEGHAPLKSAEAILGSAPELSSALLGPYAERLGPIDRRYADALYGPRSNRMESEAVAAMEIDGHPGVLCMASRDAKMFRPEQGADLVHFIARAIERRMGEWLR